VAVTPSSAAAAVNDPCRAAASKAWRERKRDNDLIYASPNTTKFFFVVVLRFTPRLSKVKGRLYSHAKEFTMSLDGRMALITGGSSGIGLATAKLFAVHGARVAITGRDEEKLAMAQVEIGPQALAISADVRSPAELAALRDRIRAEAGHLDILFANAGVAFSTPIGETDEAGYDAIMDVNLKAVFFTIQAVLPLMRPGGVIILNTSWLNAVGITGLSLLSASKAAVRSLARTLSAELLPRGIRVNAVSPGAIDTPIRRRSSATADEVQVANDRLATRIPLKRLGAANDIAEAALYLASDASRYVLGAEIVVDGGFSQL
jgi:NAD(P)-dependent dehydrogenase (short-subunit alcohol dehydrogenase family)